MCRRGVFEFSDNGKERETRGIDLGACVFERGAWALGGKFIP